MLTYQYYIPKRIDLKQLGPAREFDFYYYSFSGNQNHLSICLEKTKRHIGCLPFYKTFPEKSGWKM